MSKAGSLGSCMACVPDWFAAILSSTCPTNNNTPCSLSFLLPRAWSDEAATVLYIYHLSPFMASCVFLMTPPLGSRICTCMYFSFYSVLINYFRKPFYLLWMVGSPRRLILKPFNECDMLPFHLKYLYILGSSFILIKTLKIPPYRLKKTLCWLAFVESTVLSGAAEKKPDRRAEN